MVGPDGENNETLNMKTKHDPMLGFAPPMTREEMIAARAEEEAILAANPDAFDHIHIAEMMAELGSEGFRRRETEFHDLTAPDFADYSREHRAPEGPEVDREDGRTARCSSGR